jgi:hypothetical protein
MWHVLQSHTCAAANRSPGPLEWCMGLARAYCRVQIFNEIDEERIVTAVTSLMFGAVRNRCSILLE